MTEAPNSADRTGTLRTLVVAEAYPWPPNDGYRLRLKNLIEAFRAEGPVDFVCSDGSGRPRDPAPEGIRVIDAPERPERSAKEWMPRWVRSPDPRRMLRRDFALMPGAIASLDLSAYDVTFVSHVDSWYPIADRLTGHVILDFDNLENLLVRAIRLQGPVRAPGDGPAQKAMAAARWVVASTFNLVDERRWDRLQKRAATRVDRVLVCSELDVERSGCPNAVVVPNGYELAWTPADHGAVSDPDHPVFLFIGLMSYPPNAEAARWMAEDVLPLVHRKVPGAELRIVGRNSELVAALGELPGVTIVGTVDSMKPELDRADVSVVPIRSGAGTRLKVVEAMANRLPMVSTTIGCEGIELTPGEHLWIADDPEAFAAACVAAVTDEGRRAAVIRAAEQRFRERYEWATIRAELGALARSLVGR